MARTHGRATTLTSAARSSKSKRGSPSEGNMNRDGQVKWWGPNWHAPLNAECEEVPTPTGVPCGNCGVPIVLGERGVSMLHVEHAIATYRPWHLACLMRAVIPEWGADLCRVCGEQIGWARVGTAGEALALGLCDDCAAKRH